MVVLVEVEQAVGRLVLAILHLHLHLKVTMAVLAARFQETILEVVAVVLAQSEPLEHLLLAVTAVREPHHLSQALVLPVVVVEAVALMLGVLLELHLGVAVLVD